MEDKRRLENRIQQLEEDFEEEQTSSEIATEKSRKALQQVSTHTVCVCTHEHSMCVLVQ